MAQFEHGLYEPSEDVRAFDGSEEEDEAENSRLPLLIVLALLVLAMFGGFVWLAYNEGVARGRSEIPLVASTTTAGAGLSQPYKGFKIYEQPAPPDDDVSQAGVTPPASPQAVPALLPQAAPPKPMAKTVAPVAPKPAMAMAASKPAPETKTASKPAPAPRPSLAGAAPRSLAASAPPSATAQQSAPAAYVLQIGSYKSLAEADAAWGIYKTKHAALVEGHAPNVAEADLGAKGVWYRLRITGFSNKDAANALCGRLKEDGGACFLGK